MAIPQLSPEARAEALEKAKAARIKRAEVREELKTGKLTVAQVLDMRDDPVVGRMKISTLIETLPGYGKAKAERIMKELQIAETRKPLRRKRSVRDRQGNSHRASSRGSARRLVVRLRHHKAPSSR